MFSGSGIGAFFQPVTAASTDASPAAAIRPARKTGEETGRQDTDAWKKRPAEDDAASGPPPEDSADPLPLRDATVLSLAALRRLLAGEAPAENAATEKPSAPQNPPETARQALAAYARASTAGITPPPQAAQKPPPPDAPIEGVEAEIRGMLSRLEQSGVRDIAVPDGASIYDTLVQRCAALSGADPA